MDPYFFVVACPVFQTKMCSREFPQNHQKIIAHLKNHQKFIGPKKVSPAPVYIGIIMNIYLYKIRSFGLVELSQYHFQTFLSE